MKQIEDGNKLPFCNASSPIMGKKKPVDNTNSNVPDKYDSWKSGGRSTGNENPLPVLDLDQLK